ncbi:MAG TPA: acetyl-CoA carboxylase biotin carboxyl carrier protein [Gemmatimonadales bacterium]|nr:acetyl-CoA carboxylase biotin carboxyl carrier protein [Gemmatimonadales bacterium]
MNADEMGQLAELLSRMPGIKSVELKDVKRLADLLRESPEIGSIEVKGMFGTGIVITRSMTGLAVGPPAPPPPVAAPPAPAPAPPTPAPSNLREVKSPMVGTFYSAPEPGAEPYARVGARVSAGQTVCIIEAMKIMNEIESEFSGVIREICVEDAQPVEFGQVLFRVDPNG